MSQIQFATIPDWTYRGKSPNVYTFFESIALADLEGRRIKLDSATQRALLGFPVFGRRQIIVHGDKGAVESDISVCFGTDCETATYSANAIRRAVEANKQLRPGTQGGNYLKLGDINE